MINYTSNHWKKINNSIDHKEELKNFRRNKSKSLGMDDANKSSILNIAYYNFMKKKFGNELKKLIFENNIGNSNFILYHDGIKIDLAELKSIYYSKELEKSKKVSKMILEIGCGFGSFASKIIKEGNKYVAISLKESLLCTYYFLSENFKDKKIFISTNENFTLDEDCLNNFDIILLSPQNSISNKIKFDTVVSINTFQEIDELVAQYYKDNLFINSLTNDAMFLLVNNYFSESSFFKSNFKINVLDGNWKIIDSKRSEFFAHDHLLVLERNFNSKHKLKLQIELDKINVEENIYEELNINSRKILNRLFLFCMYLFLRIFNNKYKSKFYLKKILYRKKIKAIKKLSNYKVYEHQIKDLYY